MHKAKSNKQRHVELICFLHDSQEQMTLLETDLTQNVFPDVTILLIESTYSQSQNYQTERHRKIIICTTISLEQMTSVETDLARVFTLTPCVSADYVF